MLKLSLMGLSSSTLLAGHSGCSGQMGHFAVVVVVQAVRTADHIAAVVDRNRPVPVEQALVLEALVLDS